MRWFFELFLSRPFKALAFNFGIYYTHRASGYDDRKFQSTTHSSRLFVFFLSSSLHFLLLLYLVLLCTPDFVLLCRLDIHKNLFPFPFFAPLLCAHTFCFVSLRTPIFGRSFYLFLFPAHSDASKIQRKGEEERGATKKIT